MTRPRARFRSAGLLFRRALPRAATAALLAPALIFRGALAAPLPGPLRQSDRHAPIDKAEVLLVALVVLAVSALLVARRAARRARTQGEARFRQVLEAAPFGVVVVQDGRVVYLNDAARSTLELPDGSGPDDAALAPVLAGLAAAGPPPGPGPAGAVPRRPLRLHTAQGRAREVRLVSLDVTFDDAPARLHFFTDVTAELAIQRELELSRERLTLALEAARDGVWDADLDSGRLVHSPAFGAVIAPGGPVPEDVRSWRELVHPADRARLEQALAAHERGAMAGYECELRVRRRDGSVAWVLEIGRIVERDASGRVRRLAGTVRDITPRKRAEQRLEVRNRLAAVFPGARGDDLRAALGGVLRDVFDSTVAQVGLLDDTGDLQLTRCQGPGNRQVVDHVILPAEAWPVGLRRVLAAAEPLVLEGAGGGGPSTGAAVAAPPPEPGASPTDTPTLGAPLPGGDRVLGLVAVSGRPGGYHAEDARTLAGLAADLAPLLRAHLESEAKEAQLAQARKMEALGVLAGGIAHDFNNILQAILGFSALAKQDRSEPERVLADLDRVERATERGRDLVQRILQFSRGSEPEAPPLDPRPLVEQLVREARAETPAHVDVVGDLAAECGYVRAEPALLRQVLVNLVTNGLQALAPDGGTLTIRVAATTVAADDVRLPAEWHGREVVVFTVADTGPGIPEPHRARLFDPFFTTRDVGQGAGLGLSVVHGLVGGLGGRVTIECPSSGGTVASVHLPRAKVADSRSPLGSPAATAAAEADRRPRVLFADDDVEIRELALAILGRAGCDVDLVGDGRTALDRLSSRPAAYDALVTDEVMPGLTGRELALAAAKLRPDLPVILVTGLDEGSAAGAAPGVREVVIKPFRGEALALAVRRALAAAPASGG